MPKPKLEIELTPLDKALELATLLTIVAIFAQIMLHYGELPDRIPHHFNAAGEPDAVPASEELFTLLEQVNGVGGSSSAGSSAGSNNGILLDNNDDGQQPEYNEDIELADVAEPVPLVAAAADLDNLVVDADFALAEPTRLPAGHWVPSYRSEGMTADIAFEWVADNDVPDDQVVCQIACHGLSVTLRKMNFATLTEATWLDSEVMAASSIEAQVCCMHDDDDDNWSK